MNEVSRSLVRYAHRAAHYTDAAVSIFHRLPGSEVLVRYVRSSYQNNPIQSVIELALLVLVLVYVAKKPLSTAGGRVVLTEQEIEELIDEWQPEPLVAELTHLEKLEIERTQIIVGASGPKSKLSNGKIILNLASSNYYNFIANETLKEKAIGTLRKYGVGPCGPPNFYGTQDVHMQTESDIAAHLGLPACIIYSQGFSTISSVIPAFSKRGDIIVADRAVNRSIRQGLELSRSTIYWFEHNDMQDLQNILEKIVKGNVKKPLTRRFIVVEGLYENIGDIVSLEKLVQLKHRYKFRIILDETWSYGVLGATGRGVTEHQHVDPSQIDMLIGSMAGPLCAGGGFCAGSQEVVDHQRISSNTYTFSAALPAICATQASETVRMISRTPELIISLRDNIRTIKAQLDPRSVWVTCTSAPENPMMLFVFKQHVLDARQLDNEEQELLMQDIVDECLNNGVFITRLHKMLDQLGRTPSRELWKPPPALKVCMTVALSKKEVERAGTIIRHAITKIMIRKKLS